jgi:large subunit ribosomal protein L24
MHIKKGQKVRVLSGKDRGKTGKVLRAMPARDMVLVEGINLTKKHQRPRKSNEKGQIIDKPMPIHASNVTAAKE